MKRVLIVNYAAFIRCALNTILGKCGFQIIGEVGDRETAIKMYKELKPDIVIIDITMPEADEIEILQMLKAVDKNVQIIVIGHEYLARKAKMEGAVAFIVKPLWDEMVARTLTSVNV